MRPLATLLACLALAGLAVAAEGGAARSPAAGSYIVVFKSNAVQGLTVATTARQLASAHTGRISFVYSHALEGFAVRMTPTGAAAVARDARVAYVEPDQVIHAFASQTPATWGLDRIDQRDLPLNNTYTYNQTGAGVNAYIIDTGMRATPPGVLAAASATAPISSATGTGRTTATATGRTSPARSAERRTAWRSRSRSTPSGCSTARARARTRA